MMTARQFADKYPGQEVKLSAQGAKDYGRDYGAGKSQAVIGIVVGFRPGQKGVIGSSKVVISPHGYGMEFSLGPKTNRTYESVIPNAPAHTSGIYFISVNHLELNKPAKPLKPVVAYPNHCEKCGSPCRKGRWLTVCSNEHCKGNKVVLKAVGPLPKFKTVDHDGYVLCPFCQANIISVTGNTQYELVCHNNHKFKHQWKVDQKIWHQGATTYIWKTNGGKSALMPGHGKPTPVKYIPDK